MALVSSQMKWRESIGFIAKDETDLKSQCFLCACWCVWSSNSIDTEIFTGDCVHSGGFLSMVRRLRMYPAFHSVTLTRDNAAWSRSPVRWCYWWVPQLEREQLFMKTLRWMCTYHHLWRNSALICGSQPGSSGVGWGARGCRCARPVWASRAPCWHRPAKPGSGAGELEVGEPGKGLGSGKPQRASDLARVSREERDIP